MSDLSKSLTDSERASIALAQESPAGLALATSDIWVCPKHLDYLDTVVTASILGDGPKRIIVAMHPRSGKSEYCCRYVPAWTLGRSPDWPVIITCYGDTLAWSWSAKARNVLVDHGTLFIGDDSPTGVHVEGGRRASSRRWMIEGREGELNAAGVGGELTGKGGKLLVCDDPIKNAEQANSQVYRDKTWDWWLSTAYTRLEPDGVAIVIATRWHEDDLSGRLENSDEDWFVISFPAITEEDEPETGRKEGEALWPERYPIEVLLDKKEVLGPGWWNALYMQRPSTPEGSIFRRFDIRSFKPSPEGPILYEPGGTVQTMRPERLIWAMTVDTALKDGQRNDYTVIATVAFTDRGDMLVDDIYRERVEVPDQYPLVRDMYKSRRPQVLGIEDRQSGTGLIQQAKRDGIHVKELKPDTNKTLRAEPLGRAYRQGKVYHREGAEWSEVVADELANFPTGAHDDVVDALSYAWLLCNEMAGGTIIPERPDLTPEAKRTEDMVAAHLPTGEEESYGATDEEEYEETSSRTRRHLR